MVLKSQSCGLYLQKIIIILNKGGWLSDLLGRKLFVVSSALLITTTSTIVLIALYVKLSYVTLLFGYVIYFSYGIAYGRISSTPHLHFFLIKISKGIYQSVDWALALDVLPNKDKGCFFILLVSYSSLKKFFSYVTVGQDMGIWQ